MVSTMALPQTASMPTYPGPPMPGQPMPGQPMSGQPMSGQPMPGQPMPGPYYCNPPVVYQQQIVPAIPMVNNSNNTEGHQPAFNTYRVPMVPVGGGCYNDGMQVVWHGEFSRLFGAFFPPYHWYLSITDTKPAGKWKCHGDSAKVRFCCQDCGNGWTSMKGRVTFWYHFNQHINAGFVQFKLYGQVCKKCTSGKFEFVMWYPEEVAKVMINLYNKVGYAYYGFPPSQIRVDRRPGRPRNQHNADLCQACRDGECDQGRPTKNIIGYVPTELANRVPNQQIVPMVTSQMPVILGQPTMPHPGPVMTQVPSHSNCGVVLPCHRNPPTYITSPVTLSSSTQPILTYSVTTSEVKEIPKLTPVEEHADESDLKEEIPNPGLINGHCCKEIKAADPCHIISQATETPAGDIQPKLTGVGETIKSPELLKESKPQLNTTNSITSSMENLKINGVTSPVDKGGEQPSSNADKIFKEFSPVEATKNAPENPVMNGYATAAKKAPPKALLVNGNA